MEGARATWTDERLDDLSKSVDRVDTDLRRLRTEINARFDSLEGRLGSRIDAVEGRLGARIDGLQGTMARVGGGVIVAVLAAVVNVILSAS